MIRSGDHYYSIRHSFVFVGGCLNTAGGDRQVPIMIVPFSNGIYLQPKTR